MQLQDTAPLPPIPKRYNRRNDPHAVLDTWSALEALSPQTFRHPQDLAMGDQSCVAELRKNVPWGKGEPARPKCDLYYQVILGSIAMDRAMAELIKAFGKDEACESRAYEKAAIAAVLVDKDGLIPEENGLAVSSFAWALPLALSQQLDCLGTWSEVEHRVLERLEGIVQRVEGRPMPLDLDTIGKAYDWLVDQFKLPSRLVESPSFAIRIHHYVKSRNPPEISLLSSFYLEDLHRASFQIDQPTVPAGLRRYLAIDKPVQIRDLLTDKSALEQALAPASTPAARWPQPSGRPLVVLQQAAVNVTRSELAGKEGIVAINGPPGTGKTTLLRDLIAQSVVDRALAMSAFDDPERAFMASGHKMSMGKHASFSPYKLDPRLKGHEIIVASSNNKAVENVSGEIPAAAQVGRPLDEMAYFRSVSNFLFAPQREGSDGKPASAEVFETWGLIAAVLGNSKNRAAFQRDFWWDDERSFRLYLKAAKGDSVVRESKNPKTGQIERRTPSVVLEEQPPTWLAARVRWRKAREKLVALKAEIDNELAELERVRQTCLQLVVARKELQAAERGYQEVLEERSVAKALVTESQLEVEAVTGELGAAEDAARRHKRTRPNFFARLFRTERWKAWMVDNAPLLEARHECAVELARRQQKQLQLATKLPGFDARLRVLESTLSAPRRKIAALEESITSYRARLKGRLADAQFFSQDHETLNLSSAWLPDALQRKRENLFVAAMEAHKAFIDAAPQKILHNLSVLMDVFRSGTQGDEARCSLLGDLWSTLFLVIPVISTTFASVDSMLGELPPNSLGWLFIDEAGQAMPQAAIGAILRAKRTVVVGDPLQIPPVVTIPERLVLEICSFFNIDKRDWAAPDASAQSVADRASGFQSAFDLCTGLRTVGAPLLVHRRCQDPMFSISNAIAYNGLMVHNPKEKNPGPIGAALGDPQWFNVEGDAESNWCPLEGEVVIGLLRRLAEARLENPDLFIITPFRIVAREMRNRLEEESSLFATLKIESREWIHARIGTIHTFQGGEADTVILLLGAPMGSQNRARSWAAGAPNILNVAVSRAQQNFYVVGSHGAWSGVGYCRELADRLAVTRV